MAMIQVLEKLIKALGRRLIMHPEPDVTRTRAHLFECCFFLERVLASADDMKEFCALLQDEAKFDINKLFRPAFGASQAVFEAEREHAQALWNDLVCSARLCARDASFNSLNE